MKNVFKILLSVLFFSGALSCKYQLNYDQAGMQKRTTGLHQKFGEDAWYAEVAILSVSENETMVRVKETNDPNSLRGKEWLRQADGWESMDDVMLQFNDNKPENHLFRLGKEASMEQLATLMKAATDTLRKNGIESLKINFASIQSAEIVTDFDRRILYTFSFRDTKTQKSFSLIYNAKKELVSFNR